MESGFAEVHLHQKKAWLLINSETEVAGLIHFGLFCCEALSKCGWNSSRWSNIISIYINVIEMSFFLFFCYFSYKLQSVLIAKSSFTAYRFVKCVCVYTTKSSLQTHFQN